MIDLTKSGIHQVGSYYDIINRIWLQNPELEYEFNHFLHNFKRKPSKKLGNNKKQPPRHLGIIQKFVDLALESKSFDSRPEILMQQIFAKIGVAPAAKKGLYGDTRKLAVSGDGTCVNSGGSNYGIKECDCVKKTETLNATANAGFQILMPAGAGIAIMNNGSTVLPNTFYLSTTRI